jgi:phosphoribosylanthranilate isomerase
MTKGKTRIKICGITRIEDGVAAAAAGADAIGLVFYPKSPRYVVAEQAAAIVAALPPFVDVVGLFVNASSEFVHETLAQVPIGLLQFHGDEDETYCRQFDRAYIKAARVRPDLDLVQYAASFESARALLLDAFVDGYGGAGHVFDWDLIPSGLPRPIVLSGGALDELKEAYAAAQARSGVHRRVRIRTQALRRPPQPDLPRQALVGDAGRRADLPQARRPEPHRRAQDQQLHRPGHAGPAHGQAARHRRNRRRQHGVATATVAARYGMECVVYMGSRTSSARRPTSIA